MRGVLLTLFLLSPAFLFAATSTNYSLQETTVGVPAFSATSSNYQFKAAFGEGIMGYASSSNYQLRQGTTWVSTGTASDTLRMAVLYSAPELRDHSLANNHDSQFFLTIRSATDTDDVIHAYSELATTEADDGSYVDMITFTGLAPGTYDVGIKTHQHLTKVLDEVPLSNTTTFLNFTTLDYSSTTRGTEVLKAGDIDGTGVDVATLGDDAVNSVDLSVMLADLNEADADGNVFRSNVNQDSSVNSIDLSMILSNLNEEGED